MVCQHVGVVGKEPDIGATSRTVADNVKRLRTAHNMNFTQLSEKLLAAANWEINPVGIRRIETGERRVTPDDLTALAIALGVYPATLLMPPADTKLDPVEVTGFGDALTAEQLWDWLIAERPLPGTTRMALLSFLTVATPEWHALRKSKQLNDTLLGMLDAPEGEHDGKD